MTRKHLTPMGFVVRTVGLGLAMTLVAAVAPAQSGGPFEIRRSTIDGGGDTPKSEGTYVVRGTIGQPDPGSHESSSFTLRGGFWLGGAVSNSLIFTDGFESGDTSNWDSATASPPGSFAKLGDAEPRTQLARRAMAGRELDHPSPEADASGPGRTRLR